MELSELLERARERLSLPRPEDRRTIREAAKVTQAQIAAVLGVDPSLICRWEGGRQDPGPAHRERYAEVLRELDALTREMAP